MPARTKAKAPSRPPSDRPRLYVVGVPVPPRDLVVAAVEINGRPYCLEYAPTGFADLAGGDDVDIPAWSGKGTFRFRRRSTEGGR